MVLSAKCGYGRIDAKNGLRAEPAAWLRLALAAANEFLPVPVPVLGRAYRCEVATTGPDLLVAAYCALVEDEQDDAFDRLHQLRIEKEAGSESDMARYIRSLQRVAEEVGRTPTSTTPP